MKVIFTHNVTDIAVRGDVKNVKNGFFRNFLLPKKLAIFATDSNLKQWEEFRKKMAIEKEQVKAQWEEVKRRLDGAKLVIEKKMTSKGTLYGGIKGADVAKAIKDSINLEVSADAVTISAPIKALGSYPVSLNLGEGVITSVTVSVVEKK